MGKTESMASAVSWLGMYRQLLLWVLPLFPILVLAGNPEACRPLSMQEKRQPSPEWRIGRIVVQAQNIFDTRRQEESHRINRLANRLHIRTRDDIVQRELLFKAGDRFDPRVLAETERHLRGYAFIHDATVEAVLLCGNAVTVRVETRDNWSFTPNFSFARGGGQNRWAVEIEEENLLGLGKKLQTKYRKDIDRTEKILRYLDRNMGGSRQRLQLLYQKNSDGHLRQVAWDRPFYALDSRRAWAVNLFSHRLNNPIYRNGDIQTEIGQNRSLVEFWLGRSPGFSGGATRRYMLGFTYDDSRFFTSDNYPDQAQPLPRRFVYPWLGYEYQQDNFIEKTNLQHMGQVEDIALGHQLQARLGWSQATLGASDSDMVWQLSYRKGWQPDADQLFLFQAGLSGFYGDRRIRNGRADVKAQWFLFQSRHRSFYIKAQAELGHNLFPERQNTLGGENGLRGFPVRYLTAPNNALLTIEQRFYFDWYPYRLVQFGAAVFTDLGSAWGADDPQQNRTVQDVGFGVRLVPTQAANGKVIHIDFAFPVRGDAAFSDFQVILEAKGSF